MIGKNKLSIIKHGIITKMRDTWKIVKESSVSWSNTHSIRDLEVQEVKNVENKIFKVIVDLSFPKVVKTINPQIEKA